MTVLAENPVVAEGAASVARALSHPVRLQILELLRNEGAYVMHVTTALDRPQANVSQHLAVLREAGLVTDEREGMTVIYRVRDPRVFDLVDCMKSLAAPRDEVIGGATREPDHASGPGRRCRCPRCQGDESVASSQ